MATIYSEKEVFIKDKWQARDDYEYTKTLLSIMFLAGLSLSLIFPFLSFGFLLFIAYLYIEHKQEYFWNKSKHNKYNLELSPQLAYKTFLNVGYEVPESQIEKHLEMLRKLDSKDKEAISYLAKTEKLVKNVEKHKLVGVSKTQLVTHFWVIGTTGAGKTSMIMQLTKLLAKEGGGLIFIDGKADTKMVFKMYNILAKEGREQDFLLINFLPKENFREHTNTFNPLADMNHTEIVEFLMSAKGEATGEQVYWEERGKALLQAMVYPLYFRKKYYKENFTIVSLNSYLSDLEKFVSLVAMHYAALLYEEMTLRQRKDVQSLYNIAKQKKAPDNVFPYLDAIVYYFNLFPFEKSKTNIDIQRLTLMYEGYLVSSSYTKQISQELWAITERCAEELLDKIPNFSEAQVEQINNVIHNLKQYRSSSFNQIGTFISKADSAIQQHAYAQQQWTGLFGTLMQYSNIFGSNEPEIDMVDVLRNNKFLYVLLPALAASPQTTNLLGKLMLSAIRKAISTALGEAVEGMDDKQRNILTKRITPIPLSLLVLDEYGAYPIKGLDTILAQVRSINISVILSTQDYTSARAEGQDENSVKRAWANTQKLILRVKDNETIKQLEEIMPERFKAKYSYILSPESNYVHKKVDSVSIEKEKVFDVKLATAFKNGLGIFVTEDKAVLTQVFWADSDEAKDINLNHSILFR